MTHQQVDEMSDVSEFDAELATSDGGDYTVTIVLAEDDGVVAVIDRLERHFAEVTQGVGPLRSPQTHVRPPRAAPPI